MPLPVDPKPLLLQSSEPWVVYNTLLNLEGWSPTQSEVAYARAAMTGNYAFKSMITQLQGWPDPPLSRHNDAKHPLHKLAFLADWGFTVEDPGVKEIVDRVKEHQAVEGPLQSRIEIDRGQREVPANDGWLLCDYPTLLYAVLSFGATGKRIDAAADYLTGVVDENGWRCKGNLGFRGPGRKTDACPYANLISVKALSLTKWRDSAEVMQGVEAQLSHLTEGKKHYLFGVGSDFAKLKYPNIWYDTLHVAEALSRIPAAREDQRFRDLWAGIVAKQQPGGGFTPESVWKAWEGWSFGSKRQASPSLTYRVAAIDQRLSA
jgi:hypothetical protein